MSMYGVNYFFAITEMEFEPIMCKLLSYKIPMLINYGYNKKCD